MPAAVTNRTPGSGFSSQCRGEARKVWCAPQASRPSEGHDWTFTGASEASAADLYLVTRPLTLGQRPNPCPRGWSYSRNGDKKVDRMDFIWEGMKQPCYSYYDVLARVLSLLGRALIEANRHSYHLALLIILANFLHCRRWGKCKCNYSILSSQHHVHERTAGFGRFEQHHGRNSPLPSLHGGRDALEVGIRKKRYICLEEERSVILPGSDGLTSSCCVDSVRRCLRE